MAMIRSNMHIGSTTRFEATRLLELYEAQQLHDIHMRNGSYRLFW